MAGEVGEEALRVDAGLRRVDARPAATAVQQLGQAERGRHAGALGQVAQQRLGTGEPGEHGGRPAVPAAGGGGEEARERPGGAEPGGPGAGPQDAAQRRAVEVDGGGLVAEAAGVEVLAQHVQVGGGAGGDDHQVGGVAAGPQAAVEGDRFGVADGAAGAAVAAGQVEGDRPERRAPHDPPVLDHRDRAADLLHPVHGGGRRGAARVEPSQRPGTPRLFDAYADVVTAVGGGGRGIPGARHALIC
ncbi:hypothetical protein [Kitasatospora sp. NPDC097643]|uniref:hypothetical protein n=1 Tax=Kitasatospora sp. NPDC097643 TaxID=3157230 RepID=UPI0033263A1C